MRLCGFNLRNNRKSGKSVQLRRLVLLILQSPGDSSYLLSTHAHTANSAWRFVIPQHVKEMCVCVHKSSFYCHYVVVQVRGIMLQSGVGFNVGCHYFSQHNGSEIKQSNC